MIIHTHSDRAAFVFYDITHTPMEEVSLSGLKQSQIENILDRRGFYCQDPSEFRPLEELFTDEYVLGLVN